MKIHTCLLLLNKYYVFIKILPLARMILFCVCVSGVGCSDEKHAPNSSHTIVSDPIRNATEFEKRQLLMKEAKHLLQKIPDRYPGEIVVYANCKTAKERLENDYDNPEAMPLMLAASIVPIAEQKRLLIYSFNGNRETYGFVLHAMLPDGHRLEFIYHWTENEKTYNLVETFAIKTAVVSLEKALQQGTISYDDANSTTVEVNITDFGLFNSILLPDTDQLAVAVCGRNGCTSNFVKVLSSGGKLGKNNETVNESNKGTKKGRTKKWTGPIKSK